MLVIRKSQVHTLGESRRAAFLVRLLHIFESDFPASFAAMGPPQAEQFVARTLAAASSHGIDSEGAVIGLLGLRATYGEEFQLSPDRDWATQVLSHPTLPGVLKVSMVRERLWQRTQGRKIEVFRAADNAKVGEQGGT